MVGVSPIVSDAGESLTPATDAGLRAGDLIVAIDGTQVRSNDQVQELLDLAGAEDRCCSVEYLRQGLRCTARVEPVYCADSQSWRIGLYVRDEAAGVGTLTFWDPDSGVFGALGHNVSGTALADEGEQSGAIVRAMIQGLRKGEAGCPGEKLGVLQEEGWQGVITLNADCGVFGLMDSLPWGEGLLLETATADEVREEAAELLTVLDGETVESFQVDIIRVGGELGLNGGLVVEVTDERLLEATGGIIQGMSGSPLIQNGKLIGAVSHVFINDPSRGYAVYIDAMLEEAERLAQTADAA